MYTYIFTDIYVPQEYHEREVKILESLRVTIELSTEVYKVRLPPFTALALGGGVVPVNREKESCEY